MRTVLAKIAMPVCLISSIGTCTEMHPSESPIRDGLPFFVQVVFHIEPNPQLFEIVEPGYFETVSRCLRQMSASLATLDVHATFCFAWLYNDIVYQRNHDPGTGYVLNGPIDT